MSRYRNLPPPTRQRCSSRENEVLTPRSVEREGGMSTPTMTELNIGASRRHDGKVSNRVHSTRMGERMVRNEATSDGLSYLSLFSESHLGRETCPRIQNIRRSGTDTKPIDTLSIPSQVGVGAMLCPLGMPYLQSHHHYKSRYEASTIPVA
jgi:hypothetical protein